MACSRRCWAIGAAYYNMFACIPAVVYLLILLIVYSGLKDLRPSYADSFTVWYAKEINTAKLFVWLVLECAGVIICIRCVRGITRELIELVSQYIVWKVILTLFYGIDCLMFLAGSEDEPSRLVFPGISFVVDLVLLIIVFLYYKTMPDDSSSEEEEI